MSTLKVKFPAPRQHMRRLKTCDYPFITLTHCQNNSELDIRVALPSDASALLELFHHLDFETPYLDFKPGERSLQAWEIQRQIIEEPSGNKGAIFLVHRNDEVVGFLQAQIRPLHRLRHALNIEVGIRQRFTGQGAGRRLFETVENWARAKKVHRMDLTVATTNERALSLYKRSGFVIEGTLQHAMLLDGSFVDHYIMAKLLNYPQRTD